MVRETRGLALTTTARHQLFPRPRVFLVMERVTRHQPVSAVPDSEAASLSGRRELSIRSVAACCGRPVAVPKPDRRRSAPLSTPPDVRGREVSEILP
jgi:hypothetical protein